MKIEKLTTRFDRTEVKTINKLRSYYKDCDGNVMPFDGRDDEPSHCPDGSEIWSNEYLFYLTNDLIINTPEEVFNDPKMFWMLVSLSIGMLTISDDMSYNGLNYEDMQGEGTIYGNLIESYIKKNFN